MMTRDWVREPPLQAAEQSVQADQEDRTQSMGQACVLQTWEAMGLAEATSATQSASLPSEHVTARVWTPPPHETEQADQAPACQLGHTCVLHDWERLSTSHCLPPNWGCVAMVRVEVCLPPPHRDVHVDQADQLDSSQSMGQGCVLQSKVTDSSGQAAPPKASATTTWR